ncbi:MAG: xanthine dehydrogenase family protein subunit M [Vampirovibrionia bacterium]
MNFYSPKTIKELLELTDKYKDKAVVVAGCTDAIVKPNFFKDKEAIIETLSIEELKTIEDKGNRIKIGAGVTFADITNSELIKNNNKALYQAASVCGSPQIRNRGTIAGNIVNASPAADSVPALIVSDTTLTILSTDGEEHIKLNAFFKGPGKTILQPGQIIAYIEFNKDNKDTISFYRKIGTRKALSIAKASVAFSATRNDKTLSNIEIAYGSVGPTVVHSIKAKEHLEGKTLNEEVIQETSCKAFDEVNPINDIRSTADYRKLVIKNVIIEELNQFL